MIPSFDTINELQLYLFRELKQTADCVTVRGLKTLELNSVALRLTNIKSRCTTLNSRKWSLFFAVGEFAWHLSASNKLDAIEYYSKAWKNASDDGLTIYESCYGYKIFTNDNNQPSQWQKIIQLFRKDPFTRRAVLSLFNLNPVSESDSKDVACTCSVQFLFRNGRLDATVYMRSNDIIWGLPNDIFFFTMLQELLANELGVEPGVYNHMVGSLHLYERHFDLVESILQSNTDTYSSFEMPPMHQISEIDLFLEYEERIRKGEIKSPQELNGLGIFNYWKELLQILLLRKLGLSPEHFPNNPYLVCDAQNICGANNKVLST